MTRVVIDPNVLVSGVITPGGTTGRIVQGALAGRFALIACPHLLDELRTVLNRPRFRRYVTLAEVQDVVEALRGVADEVPDPEVIAVTRDPTDDYLVALASSAGADVLVSGDSDLRDLDHPPVRIRSPREFLEELGR